MAELYPFRGWHYDFDKVGEPSQLLAPPYDVISATEAEALRRGHPRHIAHLILGLPPERGEHSPVVYATAAEALRRFRADRVLRRDAEPRLYVLTQRYKGPDGAARSRKGLVGAVRLRPFEDRVVLPHEETFPKPVGDRLQLMRSTQMSFSHIFALYEDPTDRVPDLVDTAAGPDLWQMTDTQASGHSLAEIADTEAIAALTEAIEPLRIFIADGHHRYTAGLAYWDELGRPEPTDAAHGAAACVTMCLASMRDPGLGLFATHRLFREPRELNLSRLPAGLSVEELPSDTLTSALTSRLASAQAEGRAAWIVVGRGTLSAVESEAGTAAGELDLVLLHKHVLPALTGDHRDLVDDEENVAFSPDADAVRERVGRGEFGFGVLANPPTLDQLRTVCESGARMPHKSTYFYPKIPSGCVIRSLEGGVMSG